MVAPSVLLLEKFVCLPPPPAAPEISLPKKNRKSEPEAAGDKPGVNISSASELKKDEKLAKFLLDRND